MYASLYPSILRQFNIAAHTQIGMLTIPEQIFENENKANLDNWTRSLAFMEDLQSRVWLEICTRWFHLADYTTLYHEVERFFRTKVMAVYGLRYMNREGLIIPMDFFDTNPNSMMQTPVIFEDNDRYNVITDKYTRPNLEQWEVWRNNAIKYPHQQF